ncbi:MAG: hypothetical protein HGB12_08820 [Bacteroidetes bacterium]|nr:hypothetical protein [Bacteroidota bacterium]
MKLNRSSSESASSGITYVWAGDVDLSNAIQDSGIKNLMLLSIGTTPPNQSTLLGSTAMKSMVESFKNLYDQIIIDAPPLFLWLIQ